MKPLVAAWLQDVISTSELSSAGEEQRAESFMANALQGLAMLTELRLPPQLALLTPDAKRGLPDK